jgi:hypothetical protein
MRTLYASAAPMERPGFGRFLCRAVPMSAASMGDARIARQAAVS